MLKSDKWLSGTLPLCVTFVHSIAREKPSVTCLRSRNHRDAKSFPTPEIRYATWQRKNRISQIPNPTCKIVHLTQRHCHHLAPLQKMASSVKGYVQCRAIGRLESCWVIRTQRHRDGIVAPVVRPSGRGVSRTLPRHRMIRPSNSLAPPKAEPDSGFRRRQVRASAEGAASGSTDRAAEDLRRSTSRQKRNRTRG
jgi:hypothetical protein